MNNKRKFPQIRTRRLFLKKSQTNLIELYSSTETRYGFYLNWTERNGSIYIYKWVLFMGKDIELPF